MTLTLGSLANDGTAVPADHGLGPVGLISLWRRRRERLQLRRGISRFCTRDDHLLRDIGLDPLVLRYGLAGVHPNGRGYEASLEMALHRQAVEFAPLPQRHEGEPR
jgi:hypothetical protein